MQVKKSLMKIVKRPIGYTGRIRWKVIEMIFTRAKPEPRAFLPPAVIWSRLRLVNRLA